MASSSRTVTASAAKRVLVVGDSLQREAAPFIAAELAAPRKAVIDEVTISGSAPCDWFEPVRSSVAANPPAAVIIETFGNNHSACQREIDGSRAVTDGPAYATRLRSDLSSLLRLLPRSALVVMAIPPAAANDLASGRSHKAVVAQAIRGAASTRSGTVVVDAGRAVEVRAGVFVRYLPCLRGEVCLDQPWAGLNPVRSPDGLHFCPTFRYGPTSLRPCAVHSSGAMRFAKAAAAPVRAKLRL